MYKLLSGHVSDKGNFRTKNQDRAVCFVTKKKKHMFGIACVCDGIGSFEQSEIASELVTDGIQSWFADMEKRFTNTSKEEILDDLECTIYELNELVCEYQDRNNSSIGCTMSLTLFLEQEYFIFHVGDSRIYAIKDSMYQLTTDEVVQKNKAGKLKSYLANYIGKSRTLWLNKGKGIIRANDLFVLGTDGLFQTLCFADMEKDCLKLRSDKDIAFLCQKMITIVRERGERDNVSCILVYVYEGYRFGKREP